MLLKRGSSGNNVRIVQSRLGLKPTGYYSQITEQKVRQWQLSHQLPPTGMVDEATWQSIMRFVPPSAPAATTEITSSVSLTPPEELITRIPLLKGKLPAKVMEQLPDTIQRFDIHNILRLAHFLSQCHHESGGFRQVVENLNYSAKRLREVFPKYFPGNLADEYAYKPEKIGARVYASRMGNGDEASGDGYRYRGRGYIQLTGKDNYRQFSRFIGVDVVSQPDLVAEKYPLDSAAFYFSRNNIWQVCDKGPGEEVVRQVTKMVNGGYHGLDERKKLFQEYFQLLSRNT